MAAPTRSVLPTSTHRLHVVAGQQVAAQVQRAAVMQQAEPLVLQLPAGEALLVGPLVLLEPLAAPEQLLGVAEQAGVRPTLQQPGAALAGPVDSASKARQPQAAVSFAAFEPAPVSTMIRSCNLT